MIRRIRIAAAGLVLVFFFLTFCGITAADVPLLQFFPALLAAEGAVLIVLLAATCICGRVYCAVLCPLGTLQDLIWHLGRLRKKNARPMGWHEEHRLLRYAVLLVTIVVMAAGSSLVLNVIEPYSMFGRIVSQAAVPLGQMVFQGRDVSLGEPFLAAVLSLLCMAVLSWRYGRFYCNTICPAGTILGSVSRFSLYGPALDASRCVRCGRCASRCRAMCIDTDRQTIDRSRCVDCLDCVYECPAGAIQVTRQYGRYTDDSGDGMSRREMLICLGTAAAAAAIGLSKHYLPVEKALADVAGDGAVLPPGAKTAANFAQRCTACHRCVDHCPGGVLVPSVLSGGGAGLWQPQMDYTKGYCLADCTMCSRVCPTGAILPISIETKRTLQIGRAAYDPARCLAETKHIACGVCARHCPAHAIDMVPRDGKLLPYIHEDRCTGCGACAYHCPAQAITIRTMRVQQVLGAGRRQRGQA